MGDSKTLTTTITPSNATNKNITWKSSNDSIVTVSTTGKITAKKPGTAKITATSSNGKVSTIKISVKEEVKEEVKAEVNNTTVISTAATSRSNTTNNTIENIKEDSNPLGGAIAVGVLGAGGYWVYKKNKKENV